MVLSNLEPNISQARIARSVGNGFLVCPPSETDEAGRRIAQTVGYMSARLNQTVQVPKLARQANISPSHFFAVFKRQTGFAPLDFFIRLRVQRACELLDATSLSIKEVAGELGYDDPFYFSRVFKSVSEAAPTDYRRLREDQKQVCRARVWAQPKGGPESRKIATLVRATA